MNTPPAGNSPKPDGGYILQDFVNVALEEIISRCPKTDFVTREWLDKSGEIVEGVIADVSLTVPEALPKLTPKAQETVCELLGNVIRESWEMTAEQFRPKAWVEKFHAAETQADRERIFYWALRNKCLDLNRKKRVEERLFVSLDELQDKAEKESDGSGPRAQPLPSTSDNLEAGLLKDRLHQAMLGLPIQLAVIAYLMPGAQGNASKLARYMGIEQRQMARHLDRIRRHFKKHGLES